MAKNKKDIKKIVLAYSGGLDTSIIIPWLKENYNNPEIIAVAGNVGQNDELEGLEEKAIKTGASKLYIEDLTDEMVDEVIIPSMMMGAKYEDYLLGTAFARPIIAKRLVEIAKQEGADAICHGCTGKGNDQVRFEVSIASIDPTLKAISPIRDLSLTRDVGHQGPGRGDRLCRGPQRPPEDQPGDQLLQGQEPVAPVPRGPGSGGSRQRAPVRQARLPGDGRLPGHGSRQGHLCDTGL